MEDPTCVWHFQDIFQDRSKHELTTFSSGTDRLSVHSWLFTKASVEEENIPNIRIMTFNAPLHTISCHGFGNARPKATPGSWEADSPTWQQTGVWGSDRKNSRNSHFAQICSQQQVLAHHQQAQTNSRLLELCKGSCSMYLLKLFPQQHIPSLQEKPWICHITCHQLQLPPSAVTSPPR